MPVEALQVMFLHKRDVGWLERSETQQPFIFLIIFLSDRRGLKS
jgi:hypothetical protein